MEQREDKMVRVGNILREAVLNSTKSIGNWQKHLDFTAQFYKYGFLEQLLIESQRPDATMCATYDTWKNKLGRQVKDGANGIPLLTERNGRISMWHVFDVSDTVGNEKSIPVKAWEMKPEYRAAVGERLGKGSIDSYISARIDEILGNVADKYISDIFRSRENSLLDGLDRDNISLRFRELVKASAKYAINKRCGTEPILNEEDFRHIGDFNTRSLVIMLGKAVNGISSTILREIEAQVKAYERELSKEDKNYEGRIENESNRRDEGIFQRTGADVAARNEGRSGDDISSRYGNDDIHTADSTRTGGGLRNGYVGQAQTELSERESPDTLRGTGDGRSVGASGIGGQESGRNVGNTFGTDERSGGRDSRAEEERPYGMDSATERNKEQGSRNNIQRADIRINEKAGERSSAFSDSEDIIGNIPYRFIKDKSYIKKDTETALAIADKLVENGIKYSGKINGDTTTLTVSGEDKERADIIADAVVKELRGFFNDEQIRIAKETNIVDYLASKGIKTKRVGSNEYTLEEHDSMRINGNKFYWNSQQMYGNALNFAINYLGMDFKTAVGDLLNFNGYSQYRSSADFTPRPAAVKEKAPEEEKPYKVYLYPLVDDAEKVVEYLTKTRGLSEGLVRKMIELGAISQDERGNAVFSIRGADGKVSGAELTGTSGAKFKRITERDGSGFAFTTTGKEKPTKAIFVESAIDAISYFALNPTDAALLVSMGGLKDKVVNTMLDRYKIPYENAYIATDNDEAGRNFKEKMAEKYGTLSLDITDDYRYKQLEQIGTEVKDWNELLVNSEYKKYEELAKAKVDEFKAKTAEKFNPIERTSLESLEFHLRNIVDTLADAYELDLDIVDVMVTGSRSRGIEDNGSDIDVLVAYNGDVREDHFFNVLNDENETFEGLKIDFNPKRVYDMGDLAAYLIETDKYLDEKAVEKAQQADKPDMWHYTETLADPKSGEKHYSIYNISNENADDNDEVYNFVVTHIEDKEACIKLVNKLNNENITDELTAMNMGEEVLDRLRSQIMIGNCSEKEIVDAINAGKAVLLKDTDGQVLKTRYVSKNKNGIINLNGYCNNSPDLVSKGMGVFADDALYFIKYSGMKVAGILDTEEIEKVRKEAVQRKYSKWSYTANPVGGEMLYSVFRLRDKDSIDYSGNREYPISYVEDKEICIKIAERLNAENIVDLETAEKIGEEMLAENEKAKAEKIDPYKTAKELISEYIDEEFSTEDTTETPDFSDLKKVGLAHTTVDSPTGEEIFIQADADLINREIRIFLDDVLIKRETFNSETAFNEMLANLSFSDLTFVSDEMWEDYYNETSKEKGYDTKKTADNIEPGDVFFINRKVGTVISADNSPLAMVRFERKIGGEDFYETMPIKKERLINDGIFVGKEDSVVIPEPEKENTEIKIGDRYLYKDREYTVTSFKGIYPGDVGVSYVEKLGNTAYEMTQNINKNKLMREGKYLGNEYDEPEANAAEEPIEVGDVSESEPVTDAADSTEKDTSHRIFRGRNDDELKLIYRKSPSELVSAIITKDSINTANDMAADTDHFFKLLEAYSDAETVRLGDLFYMQAENEYENSIPLFDALDNDTRTAIENFANYGEFEKPEPITHTPNETKINWDVGSWNLIATEEKNGKTFYEYENETFKDEIGHIIVDEDLYFVKMLPIGENIDTLHSKTDDIEEDIIDEYTENITLNDYDYGVSGLWSVVDHFVENGETVYEMENNNEGFNADSPHVIVDRYGKFLREVFFDKTVNYSRDAVIDALNDGKIINIKDSEQTGGELTYTNRSIAYGDYDSYQLRGTLNGEEKHIEIIADYAEDVADYIDDKNLVVTGISEKTLPDLSERPNAVKIDVHARSIYFDMFVMSDDETGAVYLGKTANYHTENFVGVYDNSDNSLVKVADNANLYALFKLGSEWNETRQEAIDKGIFSEEDFAEYAEKCRLYSKTYEKTGSPIFAGKPYEPENTMKRVYDAVYSNYKGMMVMQDIDDNVYLGKRENYNPGEGYDNSDNSLVFVSSNENIYKLLRQHCSWTEKQYELMDGEVFSREDFIEFEDLRKGVLSQFKELALPTFDGEPFEPLDEELKIISSARSNYKDRDVMLGADGKIYLGYPEDVMSDSVYDNSDDSLIYISDNKAMFELLQEKIWVDTQEELISNGTFTRKDFEELTDLINAELYQYLQRETNRFGRRRFVPYYSEEKEVVELSMSEKSIYKGMSVIMDKHDGIFLGKTENIDKFGNYHDADDSLVYLTRNNAIFSLLSSENVWTESQKEILDKGEAFDEDDFIELTNLIDTILYDYEEEYPLTFAGKPFEPVYPEDLIGNSTTEYKIYQMKNIPENRGIRFEPYGSLHNSGIEPDISQYDLVYEGKLESKDDLTVDDKLEKLFYIFNKERPDDFTGHSLSVSDVVVLNEGGTETAHFVDDIGFADIPEFFIEKQIGLKDIVDRFFSGDETVIETLDTEWQIANGGYDLVAEIYHNGIPVCGVINDIGTYEVKAYNSGVEDVVKIVSDVLKDKGIEVKDNSEEKKIYSVVTNAGFDGGIDAKPEYATLDEAVKEGEKYLADGYLGYAVLNQETKKIERIEGDFPVKEAFNEEILRINGVNEPADKGPITMRKVGDFWEFYGINARNAAETLGLTLTRKNNDDMCGFPDYVKDDYCDKQRDAGYTVLIEEVFELNPPKRDYTLEVSETSDAFADPYCIVKTDENGDFISHYRDSKGDIPTFETIKETLEYANANNLTVTNNLEEIPENIIDGMETDSDEFPLVKISINADAEQITELKAHLENNGYDVKWSELYESLEVDFENADYVETILQDRNIEYTVDTDDLKNYLDEQEQENSADDEYILSDFVLNNMPDPTMTIEERNEYGYTWNGMLPLSAERARELFEHDHSIYRLGDDNTEHLVETADEILNNTMYGIEAETWEKSLNRELAKEEQDGDIYVLSEDILNNMPDPSVTIEDRNKYGYTWNGILPVTSDKAKELIDKFTVYELHKNNTADYVERANDILETSMDGTLYGISAAEWENHMPIKAERNMEITDIPYTTNRSMTDFKQKLEDIVGTDNLVDIVKAFNENRMHGWQGDQIKENKIKKAFNDILGDEDIVEQAFDLYVQQAESTRETIEYFDDLTDSELGAIPQEETGSFSFANKGQNYKITDYNFNVAGPKERFKNNVAAIRLLKELEESGAQATPEQQEVLAKYVGWGGISMAFEPFRENWTEEYKELKELLTEEEYASASASVLNSHYTPPEVINAVYKGLENLGFEGGRILEPSMGVGAFFGMLPESMENSKLYGVELDSISGRIAKQLYPNSNVQIKGFEKTGFTSNVFDVALGNVPFGNYKLSDTEFRRGSLIHDFFFKKSLDKVHPGGIVAFITSKGTLDKRDDTVRRYLAERAELVGAIRLPNDVFSNANAKVTSDIIFLQKREEPLDLSKDENVPSWVKVSEIDEDLYTQKAEEYGNKIYINNYFKEHPEMIAGDLRVVSSQYGFDLTCKPRDYRSLSEDLEYIVKNIQGEYRQNGYDISEDLMSVQEENNIIVENYRNFCYAVIDDEIYFRDNEIMEKQDFDGKKAERVKALVHLSGVLQELITAQREGCSDETLHKLQSKLNTEYDKFTDKYGLITNKLNRAAFRLDDTAELLASLENVNEKGELISKADIFTKRTIEHYVPIESVDTAVEALAVSISEKARVDLEFMSQLCSKTVEDIVEDLKGVIFKNPETGNYENADEYLSGNVRKKLEIAKLNAAENEEYAVNVEFLETVQPEELKPEEISVQLGSAWVPTHYYEEFMYQLLQTPYGNRSDCSWRDTDRNPFTSSRGDRYTVMLSYDAETATYGISNKTNYDASSTVQASETYGTKRANAYKILEDTLNLRPVKVMDTITDENGKKKSVLNEKETLIAQQKQEEMKAAFVEWLFDDYERTADICRIYNEKFNSVRPREYDGSHLNLVGMNPDIKLGKHQLNGIARTIYGGNSLLAHCVGAGKTYQMIASAMESKRLGLCHKSLIVVPKHIVKQVASDFMKLYPNANILLPAEGDFSKANRERFCSRIATGSYDAVIISHNQLEKIPISPERQERYLQDEINDIVEAIERMSDDEAENGFSIKQLESKKKSLQERLEKLYDGKNRDSVVFFEELGVDKMYIDEAHLFKNLNFNTKMSNIAGINSSNPSKRASDVFMKCRYLDELTDSKGVCFCTGTPLSNSMVELYIMQTFLQRETLKELELNNFDAWASSFGSTTQALELAPEGKGYRMKTRFSKFFNIPELMKLFKEIADIQTPDMLKLPVPEAEYITIATEASDFQIDMIVTWTKKM